jgi:DNA-binding response OmpR family regulator
MNQSQGQRLVLIVEDEPAIANLWRTALMSDGWGVVTASGCALALVWTCLRHPAVVLLDLFLRDGHGLQFLSALRASGNDVPVVACSAFLEPETEQLLQRFGVRQILEKPIEPQGVCAAIRNLARDQPRTRLGRSSEPTNLAAYVGISLSDRDLSNQEWLILAESFRSLISSVSVGKLRPSYHDLVVSLSNRVAARFSLGPPLQGLASLRSGRNVERIRHALPALIYSEEHVRQIAFAVGYQYAPDFNRDFSASLGVSPTVFRNLVKSALRH